LKTLLICPKIEALDKTFMLALKGRDMVQIEGINRLMIVVHLPNITMAKDNILRIIPLTKKDLSEAP